MLPTGLGEAHFARGMCRSCFLSFLSISGGLSEGGANPPAFTAARRAEERAQAQAEAEALALQAAEQEEVLALPAPQSEWREGRPGTRFAGSRVC